jgi:hypothetical protein
MTYLLETVAVASKSVIDAQHPATDVTAPAKCLGAEFLSSWTCLKTVRAATARLFNFSTVFANLSQPKRTGAPACAGRGQ